MRKNEIRNANIDFIVKRVFFPAQAFVGGQITGASVLLTAGLSAGAVSLVEIGTSGIAAMQMTAVTDAINWLWTPSDLDNRFPIYIRYYWTSAYAVANGTARFDTLYTVLKTGTVPAVGATALTLLPGASTKVAATTLAAYWSKYGVIAPLATGANAFHTLQPDTFGIAFDCKVGAVTGITLASDFVHILGAEIAYTPRLTFGGNTRRARLLIDGLHAGSELDVVNDVT